MSDIDHLLEADGLTDQGTLENLTTFAKEQLRLEAELAELEDQVKEKKKELVKVTDQIIPDIMSSLGVQEFKFEDGSVIKIKGFVSVSIPKAKEQEAFSWLRSNNHGDIIKNEINLKFAAGEEINALEASKLLEQNGYEYDTKTGVHPATLKSFATEMLEKGKPLPLEVFTVFQGKKSVINPPK